MTTLQSQLRIELVEEEIAVLMFFVERHLRWARATEERTITHQQRLVAETLKTAVAENQALIQNLQAG